MRAAIVAMIVLLCAHEPVTAQLANCQAKTCSQASSACLTQCLKTGTDCVHCHKAFTKCMLAPLSRHRDRSPIDTLHVQRVKSVSFYRQQQTHPKTPNSISADPITAEL